MRVAVYYPWVYVKSGIERIIVELKRRSRHDISILTHHYDRDATYPELKSMGVVEVGHVPVSRDYLSVAKAGWIIGRTRLDTSAFDAMIVCCEGLGSLINFRNDDRPILNVCCTPLRPVYDHEYRARVHARAGILRPALGLVEAAWRMIDRAAWRRYSAVVAISETVRRRIAAAGLWDKEVSLVYPGISRDRIRPSSTFEPFFFLPGRIMWTKNIELAVAAFRRIRETTPEAEFPFRLVVAGMVDRKSQPYLQRLRDMAAGDPAIEFRLDPSDAEMRDLYDRCWATLFTAFNEDFGITPVEAMAAAKPVLAVNRGGPVEVVVDGQTGRLLPDTPEAFAAAMRALAADEAGARAWGQCGLARAPLFTWEHFVETVDAEIDRIAARR
ncbi:MAG: glycosyltransferase [Alphaproteobacteria bacterium]|nr:glycosyltransferase [Alphaproteobacteria bacterium]